jgi:hypothetical protein
METLLHNAHKQTIIPDIGKDSAVKKTIFVTQLIILTLYRWCNFKDIYGSHMEIKLAGIKIASMLSLHPLLLK